MVIEKVMLLQPQQTQGSHAHFTSIRRMGECPVFVRWTDPLPRFCSKIHCPYISHPAAMPCAQTQTQMIYEAQVHARPIKRTGKTMIPYFSEGQTSTDSWMDRDNLLDQKPYQLPEIRGHTVHKDQKTKEEQNTYPKKSNSEIRN